MSNLLYIRTNEADSISSSCPNLQRMTSLNAIKRIVRQYNRCKRVTLSQCAVREHRCAAAVISRQRHFCIMH